MRVIVVGAGVIGLSCAVRLSEAGYDVAVFARDLPLETTSAVAGAMWHPFLSAGDRIAGWARSSYDEFVKLAGSEPSVQLRHGKEYYRESTPAPAWAADLPDLQRVGSLPPGFRDGWAFTTPVVEMPGYLRYLVKRLEAAGGTLNRAAFSSLPNATGLVVNCTGLGARLTAQDPTVTPVRGQLLAVEQFGLTEWMLADHGPQDLCFALPRSNDIIVGGTAESDNWDLTVDEKTTEQIIDRAASLIPELRKAKILRQRVGLRPARPSVRCESVRTGDRRVIHCYGHGGSGVTLSWGCADEVLELVREG